MSDEREVKPPSAFRLQSGDVAGFGWDFGGNVVLYFQPPSLRGAVLQVAMSREQFFKLCDCAKEMEAAMSHAVLVEDTEAPNAPVPAMAGEES